MQLGQKTTTMAVVYTRSIACQADREKESPANPASFVKLWMSPAPPPPRPDAVTTPQGVNDYD